MTAYRSPWSDGSVHEFRRNVRRFLNEEFLPRQDAWRRQHRPEPAAWLAAGRASLLLPEVPEEYGGSGGSFAHMAVVLEELARAGIHFGAVVQAVVARYLLAYGNERQKQRWLPRLVRGELVAAIAMTEPDAGSDLQGIKTVARRDGDCYRISGTKTFITNGTQAGLVCLAVKTDPRATAGRGISLVLVETENLPGFSTGAALDKVGMHSQDTCELFFADVAVPVENLLGPAEGKGFAQMMEQLPYERLMVGVIAVAVMERAVELTTGYVKERRAFDKTLFDFQNTRFKLAECSTRARVGRVFIDHCIQRFLDGGLDDQTSAMAKYWLTDIQCQILDECLQLHGGYGYMNEYLIARLWADSRVQRIYAGANEVMKEIIAWSL